MLKPHVAAGLLNLFIGFIVFYFSLLAGIHAGRLSRRFLAAKDAPKDDDAAVPPKPPEPASSLNVCVLLLAATLWVVFGVLYAVVPTSRIWTGPAFLTPFGAGLRWYTSIWNANCPRFKWATYLVNSFGVLVYVIVLICETKYTGPSATSVRTTAFVSIMAGFCGSLTTASTFFLELDQISPRYWASIYAMASTLTAQFTALVAISVAKFGFSITL